MKTNTIKWRIFKYNLMVIVLLIASTTVIFNVAVRVYLEKDIIKQLDRIATRTEDTALRQGPDFFPRPDRRHQQPPTDSQSGAPPNNRNNNKSANKNSIRNSNNNNINNNSNNNTNSNSNNNNNNSNINTNNSSNINNNNELFRFYYMLDLSIREPLSVLNANFILLDSNKNIIYPSEEVYYNTAPDLVKKITDEVSKYTDPRKEEHFNFNLSNTDYISIIKPVSLKNTFGLGWIVIYSSVSKINELQLVINAILFAILILSSIIILFVSSLAAKRISAPFSSMNQHIRSIAERNFGNKINVAVDDELQELVNNINTMSEKLETYDKAQKTFLQNASHEFRTPLMSIQSYAEGIKYDVVESDTAVSVIIDETKRMTHLVEDLLYLSRLDTIEENYHFNKLDFYSFIDNCVERLNGIAIKHDIKLQWSNPGKKILVNYDEEKLSRAITNIISNCIRYAKSVITISAKITDKNIELSILDDGSGFNPDELPYIFERFYKGKKGKFGLGLAITKNVIEKHKGKITAENSATGALFKIILPIAQVE
ncbi:MAG: HAMP domain-containing sensor histidine kinase [Bacillota bacterium]|nr:HAMP domain-containing sensor histidine kinase [Bacillota bacterium]